MIIARYLTREILQTLVAITIILLLVFMCNTFVRYLGYVAHGKYASWVLIKIVLLQVPILFGLLLPLGLYLGILLSYGRMYADSEMTVLGACGFSARQLCKYTFVFALGVALLSAALSFWIQPIMTQRSRLTLELAASGSMLDTLVPGRFTSLHQGSRVFYVQKTSKSHHRLEQTFLADRGNVSSSDKELKQLRSKPWVILSAQSAHQEVHHNLAYIVLNQGHLYKGIPGSGVFSIVTFDEYGSQLQSPSSLDIGHPADMMGTMYLIKHLHERDMRTELAWRTAAPISVLILTLIALPLSQLKPRQGRFAKLLPGAIIYIVYVNLLILGRGWMTAGQTPIWIGLWWIHSIFLMLGLLLLRWLRF